MKNICLKTILPIEQYQRMIGRKKGLRVRNKKLKEIVRLAKIAIDLIEEDGVLFATLRTRDAIAKFKQSLIDNKLNG